MVETSHCILLSWCHRALNDKGKTEAHIAGVFAADNHRLRRMISRQRKFEFLARLQRPLFEHANNFAFTTTEITRDNELHIIRGMRAAIVFAHVF